MANKQVSEGLEQFGSRVASEAVWSEVDKLRTKLRMIVSHATGGHVSDIDMSVNDICVEISRSKNEVWRHAQEVAHREQSDRITLLEAALRDARVALPKEETLVELGAELDWLFHWHDECVTRRNLQDQRRFDSAWRELFRSVERAKSVWAMITASQQGSE